MHYFGENMHKTKVFCIKVKNMLNDESLFFCFVSKCIPFQSKYIRKGRRESPIFAMWVNVYLKHIDRIP